MYNLFSVNVHFVVKLLLNLSVVDVFIDFPLKFEEYMKLYVDCFRFEYPRTSRTLCPNNNYYSPHHQSVGSTSEVIVSVSTASPYNLSFSLRVSQETNFSIK